MKVQVHSSSEPPLKCNQSGLDALKESKSVKRFLTIVEVSFRFVLEWKSGREIPGSSRLEISANNLAIWVFFLDSDFAGGLPYTTYLAWCGILVCS